MAKYKIDFIVLGDGTGSKEVKEYLKSVENKNSKFLLNILDREFTVDEIEQFLEITGQYLSVPKFNNNRK